MSMKTIQGIVIQDFVDAEDHESGALAAIVTVNDTDFGLLVPETAFLTLAGALLEAERRRSQDGLGSADLGIEAFVSDHEIRVDEVDQEKIFFRIQAEEKAMLTLRIGLRRARQMRDQLSGQIEMLERLTRN